MWALARYNSDGSLDATFDGDGKVTTDIGSSTEFAHSVLVQPDGKLVVGGEQNRDTTPDFCVARYNGDGSLDATFGRDGIVVTPVSSGYDTGLGDVLLQPDGKIIQAGIADIGGNRRAATMVRCNPNRAVAHVEAGGYDHVGCYDRDLCTEFSNQHEMSTNIAAFSNPLILYSLIRGIGR